MLTKRGLKLLDFGLAKLLPQASCSRLLRAQVVVAEKKWKTKNRLPMPTHQERQQGQSLQRPKPTTLCPSNDNLELR